MAYKLDCKKNLYLFVGKQIVANISDEQREFIAKQPSPDRSKWLNKLFRDQGLQMTNNTAICIYYFGSEKNKEEIKLDILEEAKKILLPKGYAHKGSMSTGSWGNGDMYADVCDIEKGIKYIGQDKTY